MAHHKVSAHLQGQGSLVRSQFLSDPRELGRSEMRKAERIRKMLLDVIDDVKVTEPEQMRVQLIAAGWTPQTQSIWRDPRGKLHLGPYGAWKKMCAEVKAEDKPDKDEEA
jgi:hypothetical protein